MGLFELVLISGLNTLQGLKEELLKFSKALLLRNRDVLTINAFFIAKMNLILGDIFESFFQFGILWF